MAKNSIIWKAFADRFSGNTTDNRIRRHIFCHNGASANNCTIANGDARQDNNFISNPHIVSDDNIAFVIPCARYVLDIQAPTLQKKIGNG